MGRSLRVGIPGSRPFAPASNLFAPLARRRVPGRASGSGCSAATPCEQPRHEHPDEHDEDDALRDDHPGCPDGQQETGAVHDASITPVMGASAHVGSLGREAASILS
jgi:hypothetical protein